MYPKKRTHAPQMCRKNARMPTMSRTGPADCLCNFANFVLEPFHVAY